MAAGPFGAIVPPATFNDRPGAHSSETVERTPEYW